MARLCHLLLKITQTAEEESAAILQPHESVLRSLQQTDREASMKPLHEALAKLRERIESGQKPSSMVPLMKTSHRSFSFPSTGAGSSPRQSRQIDSATAALPPVIPESPESSPLAPQAIDPSAVRSNTAVTNSSINQVSIQEQIDAHKAQKGVRKLFSTFKTKPDKELKTWLQGRDIVCFHPSMIRVDTHGLQIILLDNGKSMAKHWTVAVDIVELLVSHGTKFDDNGVDFYVTNHVTDLSTQRRRQRDFGGIKRSMEGAYPKLDYATDMPDELGKLFTMNVADLMLAQRRGRTLRKMTFFILTDAEWEGTDNRDAVGDKIVSFVRRAFSILGDLEDRAVSIQFIQFGRDRRSTEDLRKLDDELEQKGIPYVQGLAFGHHFLMNCRDVIDVEPCDGAFYKMFLGSVSSKLDKLDTALAPDTGAIAISPVLSPSAISVQETSTAVQEKSVQLSYSAGPQPSPSPPKERRLSKNKFKRLFHWPSWR